MHNRLSRSAILLIAAINFLSIGIARSQDLTAPLPNDPNVRTGKLPNGLTFYIRKNSKPENRVELRLAVKAGSILENDDQQGLAHLTEHMAFNGTKKWPKNDLINFLESSGVRFGAHLNAYTSFDETVYMLQLPTNKPDILEKGLDVLSEWSHNVTFDTTEINKERGVVGEEWRLGLGANERIENKELPIILKGSRYADRITIGKKEIIDTAHYSTLTSFYHDWYRPDLMAVIVVGDIDPDKILAALKAHFSDIPNPANERERTEFGVPAHAEPYVSVQTDKELPYASFSIDRVVPHPEEVTVADYRREIMHSLCDQIFNRRISDIGTKQSQPFTSCSSREGYFLDHTDSYSLFILLKSDSIMGGIHAGLREAFRAAQQGFSEAELIRAKKDLMVAIENEYNEREKTNSSSLIGEYTRNFLQGEPFPGISYEYGIYKRYLPTITLEEINLHLKERMSAGSVLMTLSAPQSDTIKIPSKEDLLAIYAKVQSEKLPAYEDQTSDEPLLPSPPKPGTIVSEKTIKDLGVTEWTLSNGAKVLLKPTDFKADQILFQATAPGGTSIAPDSMLRSAEAASFLVSQSGLGKLDVVSLRSKLAGKFVSIFPSIGNLSEGLTGRGTPRDIETMFQVVYLYFTAPRLDTTAVKATITKQRAMLQNRDRNPNSAMQDTIAVTMSQYNPRRKPMTAESLSEVKPLDGYKFFKARFADAGHFTFILVGNFDLANIKPLVEEYLASLPATNSKETWRDEGITPPAGQIEKKVYKGMEPKSSVSIAITGPFDWTPQNRYNLAALAEVLNIKLREDLREDKSGVYGIRVAANPTKIPRERYELDIRFGCAPERVDELVAEVMRQLDSATMRPCDTIYVHKVQEIERTELETSSKENDYWLGSLATAVTTGDDPMLMLKRREMIDHLTPEAVFAAAKKYLDRRNMVQVELMPAKQ